MDYFVPLSSPDKKDFDRNGKVKKSTITIVRMIFNGRFIGKILINNMIPVPLSETEEIVPVVDKDLSSNADTSTHKRKKMDF